MRKTQNSVLKTQVFCALCLLSLALFLNVQPGYGATVTETDSVEGHRVYIISPGDQLLISVFGQEKDLTALAVVRPDGMIAYPLVGDTEAAGLTINQLSIAISNQLSELDFYENPQVTIQLQESSQENIYVFGDVKEPGLKQFPRAINAIEALASAGGFIDTADLANAKIIKKQKEIIPIDLGVLLTQQDAAMEELLDGKFMLGDGDVLMIPSAIKIRRVSVIGQVNVPGQYPIGANSDLIEVLAMAGGTKELIADLRHIKIIKSDGDIAIVDATQLWAGVEGNNIPPIQPGDSVVVPEKRKISILGAVVNQGQHNIDGEIGIIEALSLAGIMEDSNLGKLKIVRSSGERFTINASKIWEQQGEESEIKLIPGDTLIVPTAFKINWNAINIGVLALSWLYTIFKQ